jgi:hypothetical protein
MSQKEMALALWWKFYSRIEHKLSEEYSPHDKDIAKQLAIDAVDEIFEFMRMDDEDSGTLSNANSKWVNYWSQVKEEIEKL